MARLFSQGGLIILAGYLESRTDVPHAWMVIFATMGAILMLLGVYHWRVLPTGGVARHSGSLREIGATFWDVLISFLKKPNIYLLLLFILLYRAGEGQVVTIGPLFLVDKRAVGGLGLSMDLFGTIYGTFGTLAFLAGTMLGGYFTSWLGLRRAILPLICAMNFPNLAYVYLSMARPTNHVLIGAAMSVEMFGYGFGFVGVMLLKMCIRDRHCVAWLRFAGIGTFVPG